MSRGIGASFTNPEGKMIRKVFSDYYQATSDFSRNAKLFLASMFLVGMCFSAFGVIFNLYLVEAGFREGFIGNLLSVGALAMSLLALPAGLACDRIGRKKSLLLSGFLVSVFVLIRATTLQEHLLLTASALSGFAAAFAAVTTAPFLMENSTPEERTHLFSVNFSALLIAGVIGNALGGKLPDVFRYFQTDLTKLQSYRMTLVTSALFSFASLIPLFLVREGKAEARGEQPKASWREKEDLVTIGKFSLNNFLIGAGAGLVIPFFNLYFAKRFGATSTQIGLYFSGSQIITAAAVLLGPIAAKRFGKLKTIVYAQIFSLPFLVLLGGLERYLAFAVLAFWLRACLMNMSGPLGSAMTMEMIPENKRATAASIMSMSWNLSWAGTTALSGHLMQSPGISIGRVFLAGYSIPYYLTALIYFLATTSFYFLFKGYEGEHIEPSKAHRS